MRLTRIIKAEKSKRGEWFKEQRFLGRVKSVQEGNAPERREKPKQNEMKETKPQSWCIICETVKNRALALVLLLTGR